MEPAGGGCPRFVPIAQGSKTKAKKTEEKAKRPASAPGIDIKLVTIRDILSRDRHKTDTIPDEERGDPDETDEGE